MCGTVWHSVAQCGAVWCSAVQCGVVWCSVAQCNAVLRSVVQFVAVCCSALCCVVVRCSASQCVAVCCSALQYVAVRWSVILWWWWCAARQHFAGVGYWACNAGPPPTPIHVKVVLGTMVWGFKGLCLRFGVLGFECRIRIQGLELRYGHVHFYVNIQGSFVNIQGSFANIQGSFVKDSRVRIKICARTYVVWNIRYTTNMEANVEKKYIYIYIINK